MPNNSEYNPNDWISPKIPRACYYATHKISKQKVLIPMCWGTVHSNDIEDCCCDLKKQPNIQDLKKENQILRDRVNELEEELTYHQRKYDTF